MQPWFRNAEPLGKGMNDKCMYLAATKPELQIRGGFEGNLKIYIFFFISQQKLVTSH